MIVPQPRPAKKSSPAVVNLCSMLVRGEKPLYLDIEKVEDTEINDCYYNVQNFIKKNGGSIQYGWQIWETLPDVMCEAEFHAVWVDKKGNFRDITPKSIPNIKRILFLPDPARKYEGKQIDNFRVALKDDPIVHRFIEVSELFFLELNKGKLADYHGPLILNEKMKYLKREQDEKFNEIIVKYYLQKQAKD